MKRVARPVALTVSAALVTFGLASPARGEGAAQVECQAGVDDPVVAAATAVACGIEVEVMSSRTPWESVYATPGGASRMEISAVASRTDVNGSWEAIDTTVVEGDDGITVAAPALPITFSDGSPGMPLATIESDGHVLEFHAPFELTVPVLEADRVTYPKVLPGVDLIASVDEDGSGFSEVLRVETPEAAAHPALAELQFPVTVSAELTIAEAEGGFVATDQAGEEVFSSPIPLMWDSGTPSAYEQSTALAGAWSAGVSVQSLGPTMPLTATGMDPDTEPVVAPALNSDVAEMPVDLVDGAVSVTPDSEMISDPETDWPIYIDPSVGRDPVEWIAIRSGVSSAWKFSGDQGLGLCEVSMDSACGEDFKSRLVWEFHDLGVIENVAAADITSGELTVFGSTSFNCTSYAVRAYRVENIASGTTWASNSGWTDDRLQSSRDVHHRSGCADGPRPITWDVTDAARHTATNGGYLSIGLKDYGENSMSRWKRYRNDATLSIVYNQAPNVPSGRHATAGTSNYPCSSESGMDHIPSTTPTLNVVASDPDAGHHVRVRFQVIDDASGSVVWESVPTTAQASGQEHSVTVPAGLLRSEQVYRWQAQAANSRASAWTNECYFRPDVTAPRMPIVRSAQYPEDAISGGTETKGVFRFEPNGDRDIAKYAYNFTSDALDCRVIATGRCISGESTAVTFDPTRSGSHALKVQAFDKAGNGSPVQEYLFVVGFPHVTAYWHLDEGGKDSASGANPLTITGASQVDGPFREADSFTYPNDWALRFDAPTDTAVSNTSAVHTDKSFTVTAFVSPDANTSVVQAAVSQEGEEYSGFKLGRLNSSYCPNGMSTCYGFWMKQSDTSTGANTMVVSDDVVEPGQWTHLTGVYDASTRRLSLYTCNIASVPEPTLEGTATHTGTAWRARGSVQLGRALHGGAYRENWVGRIDDVRLYESALDVERIRQICTADQT